MIYAIAAAIVIALLVLALAGKKSEGKASYKQIKPLTEKEQAAYWRIKEALGDEKVLLAQVAFSSFLRTTGEKKAANSKFYKARQKVADFIVCNKDFSIHAIIEIDDKTHKEDKDAARDQITNEAGIKTLRYKASTLPSIEELKKELLK